MSELRIVSLVPSVTELVCDLGLADRLVGRTGFCVHPWETVRKIPKVGGTKDVRIDRVRALAPTHVIVNVDENRREDAEAIGQFAQLVVTHPLGPQDNFALYRQLGAVFDRAAQAERLCAELAAALASLPPVTRTEEVLYLIWREPWMTVFPDTYIARTLALVGWLTGSADSPERYPAIELADHAGRVSRVLLSSEPYHFKAAHVEEVRALVPGAEVSLIDGEMVSWYGSRAIRGVRYLAALADLARVSTTASQPAASSHPASTSLG